MPNFGWSYPPGSNAVPDDEITDDEREWENQTIAEGVKQTVKEIQTERERLDQLEQSLEQLKQKVDDALEYLAELRQYVENDKRGE